MSGLATPLLVLMALCAVVHGVKIRNTDNTVIKAALTDDKKHTDCHSYWKSGLQKSGVYIIHPNRTNPIKVYCNMTKDGGFTVIQRRMSGQLNFNQPWNIYKYGFGSAANEYWAGLETIHHLTTTGNNILRIDLTDWNNNQRFITYSHFQVMAEAQGYKMFVSGGYGNIPDDLSFSNGMQFYTYDRTDINNCALHQRTGWWYNYCSYALLNGRYYQGGPYTPTGGFYDGIYWKDWMGYGYSMKYASMVLYHN